MELRNVVKIYIRSSTSRSTKLIQGCW